MNMKNATTVGTVREKESYTLQKRIYLLAI